MKSKYVCQRLRTLKSNNSKSQLRWITELNLFFKKIRNPYDDYIPQLKNESKVQSDLSQRFVPSHPITYVSLLPALPKSGFQKPIMISNQDCSLHCNEHGLSAPILYWVTNTQYLMRHWSFSFPFLFSA